MVYWLSERLTDYIYNRTSIVTQRNVVLHGMKIITNASLVIIISLLASWILSHNVTSVWVSMTAFALLRSITGGYHLQSSDWCVAVSVAMIIAPTIVNPYLTDAIILFANLLSLFILLVFAPSQMEYHAKYPKGSYFILKMAAAGLVIINTLLLNSGIIALAFVFQSLSLLWRNNK